MPSTVLGAKSAVGVVDFLSTGEGFLRGIDLYLSATLDGDTRLEPPIRFGFRAGAAGPLYPVSHLHLSR